MFYVNVDVEVISSMGLFSERERVTRKGLKVERTLGFTKH